MKAAAPQAGTADGRWYNGGMSSWLYAVIAVAAALLLAAALAFNRMTAARNKVRRAWGDVDVQLKLRHELIPRLVEIAEGYALHERKLLESVTAARARAQAVSGVAERGETELSVGAALREVLLLGESYPQLKADELFERLSAELVTVENHLAASRKYYNGAVRIYNTFVQSFPQLLLARLFRFRPAEYFQLDEDRPSPA